MLTTLDQLDYYVGKTKGYRRKKIGKEAIAICAIFVIASIVVSLVTNWTVFSSSFLALLQNKNTNSEAAYLPEKKIRMSSFIPFHGGAETTGKNNEIHPGDVQKKNEMVKISKLMETYAPLVSQDFSAGITIENTLKEKLDSYTIGFNTLPPTNRLIIPKLGQNVPLIVPRFGKSVDELTKEDFDKPLYKGVVKYPTTAIPGTKGNTLLFGHTSYEEWKQNKYGTVFSGLPKLEKEDMIQIVRDGQIYTYKVLEKKVIKPKQVNEEYTRYNKDNNNFLTLMGCYPIGSDANRILIHAERVM